MIAKKILKIKNFFEFSIIYLIYIIFLALPKNIVSSCGGKIFEIIGPLTKRQRIAEKNYLNIFPKASKKEIKNDTRASWSNLGRTFCELFILSKLINSKENIITIEGLDYIKSIILKDEQAIFVGIHESNWEILAPSMDKLGIHLGAIYRHINNHYIDNLVLKIRSKSLTSCESFYTPKGKQSAKDIITAIKKKMSVILLIDQRDTAGDLVNLFNKHVKTQTGFLKLSKKYNMKIIPIQNTRVKKNYFKLKFHRPIKLEFNEISDIKNMQSIHKIIEKWIAENPSNYFLQHNRFG